MSASKIEDKNFVQVLGSQNLIDYVLLDLEKRVKKDKATKLSVFFTTLSAYLPELINLFLKGEGGIGKSYNVVQTLQYFPKEDVWFLGGLSPKALIHEHGILLSKDGEELKAYAEEIGESYTLINLRNKILVFLEVPEYETFRMLYRYSAMTQRESNTASQTKRFKGR